MKLQSNQTCYVTLSRWVAVAAGAELYKEVKRASDSYLGIPSQCFVARKASIGVPQARGRPQYCANIAMKVNAKLDGVNCALATVQPFMQKPFMVIGGAPRMPCMGHICACKLSLVHPGRSQPVNHPLLHSLWGNCILYGSTACSPTGLVSKVIAVKPVCLRALAVGALPKYRVLLQPAGTGVTHPMGYNETEPSIAAVVGSMDAKCSRYSAEVQLQGHRVEIIQAWLHAQFPPGRPFLPLSTHTHEQDCQSTLHLTFHNLVFRACV